MERWYIDVQDGKHQTVTDEDRERVVECNSPELARYVCIALRVQEQDTDDLDNLEG